MPLPFPQLLWDIDRQRYRDVGLHMIKKKLTDEMPGAARNPVRNSHSCRSLTVELEVVVHDKAAGQSESNVVIVLKRLQQRVIQVLVELNDR